MSTVINYFSRQTLSVLAPVISSEMHLSHAQLSSIFSSFQFSYACAWLLGGVFLDIVGTRMGLALAVVWWSIVGMTTSLVHSVASFRMLRLGLGIGEGFNWPGASKSVAEWFPPGERSLAVAIFDSGSSVGAALAALTLPWVAIRFGWRSAFLFSGVLGFVWLFGWLLAYPSSARNQVREKKTTTNRDRGGRPKWISILKEPKTWAIFIGRSLTDPVWWFYVFWLPQYLSDARGFSLKSIAIFAWMPFVAADIGNFVAGWTSGALIRRGIPIIKARKWVCVVSCVPILAGFPAALVSNPFWALGLICIALFGSAAWSTMGLTLPSDLFSPEVVGSVTGLSGLGAGLIGALFTLLVGIVVDRFSYIPAFLAAALAPLVATGVILLLVTDKDGCCRKADGVSESIS